MTEYHLYLDTWANGENTKRTDCINMLNSKGKSCCLGQFALQVLGKEQAAIVKNTEEPGILARKVGIYDRNFLNTKGQATPLAEVLIEVNDSTKIVGNKNRANTIKNVLAAYDISLIIHE